MSHFITESVQLNTLHCSACAILFAIPQHFQVERMADGARFYCPNGHAQVYGIGEVGRLKKELEDKSKALTVAKCESAAERMKRESLEKEMQRHQKRTKNGVCPCCNRTFLNLQRHMKTKHPGFGA